MAKDEGRSHKFDRDALRIELEQELVAMSLYLSGNGQPLPSEVLPVLRALDDDDGNDVPFDSLAPAHAALANLSHPASPRALVVLCRNGAFENARTYHLLPLSRAMIAVTVVSMFGLVLVGMSPEVGPDPTLANPTLSSGWPLLINQVFFMFAAALGAAFHGLFSLNRHITEATYDPRYDSSYWTRLVLGIIAGTILCLVVRIPPDSSLYGVGRHIIALLGGFSAGLVHRVLNRLVATVESIFESDPKSALQKKDVAASVAQRQARDDQRLQAASTLLDLQSKITDDTTPAQLRAHLSKTAKDLRVGFPSPHSTPEPEPAPAPAPPPAAAAPAAPAAPPPRA